MKAEPTHNFRNFALFKVPAVILGFYVWWHDSSVRHFIATHIYGLDPVNILTDGTAASIHSTVFGVLLVYAVARLFKVRTKEERKSEYGSYVAGFIALISFCFLILYVYSVARMTVITKEALYFKLEDGISKSVVIPFSSIKGMHYTAEVFAEYRRTGGRTHTRKFSGCNFRYQLSVMYDNGRGIETETLDTLKGDRPTVSLLRRNLMDTWIPASIEMKNLDSRCADVYVPKFIIEIQDTMLFKNVPLS